MCFIVVKEITFSNWNHYFYVELAPQQKTMKLKEIEKKISRERVSLGDWGAPVKIVFFGMSSQKGVAHRFWTPKELCSKWKWQFK